MIDLSTFDNSTFDRGANRLKEAAWWLVRAGFFMGSIPLPSRIRVCFLRLFGAQIGRHCVIRSRVSISHPWRLEVGDHVWIGDDVRILSLDSVVVESNSCLSQETFICTGSHEFHRSTFDLTTKPIRIGAGSWLCARTFVGPGVTISPNTRCLPGAIVLSGRSHDND